MDTERLITYLNIQGLNEDKIKSIISSNELRSSIVKMILDYENELSQNGFTKRDALYFFKSYQKMVNYEESMKKLEQQIK